MPDAVDGLPVHDGPICSGRFFILTKAPLLDIEAS
jgi:hypothetical protein